jgi:hypothetical protein
MRLLNHVLPAVWLLGSGIAHAAELMPRTVFFDPPPYLVDKGNGSDPRVIRWFLGRDDVPGKYCLRLNLGKRAVGFTNGPVGQPAWLRVDQKVLGRELLAQFKGSKTNHYGQAITGLSGVINTQMGGLPAVQVSYQRVKTEFAPVLYTEIYWAQYDTNMAVTVEVTAHSSAALQSLKGCLAGLRIKKKE